MEVELAQSPFTVRIQLQYGLGMNLHTCTFYSHFFLRCYPVYHIFRRVKSCRISLVVGTLLL